MDAEIILCALYRREGQTARAIPLVSRLIERYPRNYLLRFELAEMSIRPLVRGRRRWICLPKLPH